jgi:hypothetical protein
MYFKYIYIYIYKFSLSTTVHLVLGPHRSPVQWVPGFFPGVTLGTPLHLLSSLRMSGAKMQHPLSAFMASTRTALPLPFTT